MPINYRHMFYGRMQLYSIAYTVFVWSRLSAPVELSTRYTYTTPDTTVEIVSRSASGIMQLWAYRYS